MPAVGPHARRCRRATASINVCASRTQRLRNMDADVAVQPWPVGIGSSASNRCHVGQAIVAKPVRLQQMGSVLGRAMDALIAFPLPDENPRCSAASTWACARSRRQPLIARHRFPDQSRSAAKRCLPVDQSFALLSVRFPGYLSKLRRCRAGVWPAGVPTRGHRDSSTACRAGARSVRLCPDAAAASNCPRDFLRPELIHDKRVDEIVTQCRRRSGPHCDRLFLQRRGAS